jgi:signal transduction histidine kinase
LNRFDRTTEQFTVYRHTDERASLSNDAVNAIYEDHAGNFWVGGRKGLQRMDRTKGTFANFTIKDGLPDDTVESILEDGHGDLWIGTHAGLSQFNPRNRTFRNYTESDGLAGDDLDPFGAEGSCVTREGELVFGSKEGLTVFHPDRLSPNPYIPPVVLTDFLVSNKPLPKPIWDVGALTLNHSQNIFAIEFASLSYADPQKDRYRYRLEGFDSQWNEVDSGHHTATYTNLPARTYIFRVQGSNNDGVWNSKGIALAVTVLPPWWETWWFRSILILSAAAVIFAAYQARIRQLNLRFEDRLAERTRIAQELHDTLIQDMVGVGLQLDIMEDQVKDEPNAVPATLEIIQNRVQQAVSRGRHALSDLRSHSAGTDNLIESLSRVGMELSAGEAPRFHAFIQGGHIELHSLIWHELDRIGREAITNAFRHANAKSIEAGLYVSDHAIQLVVRDDGCGMPASLISQGRSGHFGLRGMRERAERAGGRLSLRSRSGGGTEVSVTVPLRNSRETKSLSSRIASFRPFAGD